MLNFRMQHCYYILFGIVIFQACSENQKPIDSLNNSSLLNDRNDSVYVKGKEDVDLVRQRADSFVQSIIGTEKVYWLFDISDKNLPRDFKVFKTEGLLKIHAYSRKNYPKKSKPNSYEHFVLWLLEYQTKEEAKASFEQYSSDIERFNVPDSMMNRRDYERIRYIHGTSKYGGFICQKDRYVINLVETCDFSDKYAVKYEKRFIAIIFDKSDKNVIALNADCGEMKYVKQIIN